MGERVATELLHNQPHLADALGVQAFTGQRVFQHVVGACQLRQRRGDGQIELHLGPGLPGILPASGVDRASMLLA